MAIEIYTDGSCIGNPGPGGWGFIIIEDNKILHQENGPQSGTTNNRMEMMALVKALEYAIKEGLNNLHVYSDSRLLVNTINEGWKKKANRDIWQALDSLLSKVDIKIEWVKAHHENEFNNMVDELAFEAAQNCPDGPPDEGVGVTDQQALF